MEHLTRDGRDVRERSEERTAANADAVTLDSQGGAARPTGPAADAATKVDALPTAIAEAVSALDRLARVVIAQDTDIRSVGLVRAAQDAVQAVKRRGQVNGLRRSQDHRYAAGNLHSAEAPSTDA